MTAIKLKPCPDCGGQAKLSDSDGWGYTIACADCYDGAPDAPNRSHFVYGPTVTHVSEQWNELVDDLDDRELNETRDPGDILADLAKLRREARLRQSEDVTFSLDVRKAWAEIEARLTSIMGREQHRDEMRGAMYEPT